MLLNQGCAFEGLLKERDTIMTSKTHEVLSQNLQYFEKLTLSMLSFHSGKVIKKTESNGCT